VIEGVVHDVLDPTKFTPTGDLKNSTRELAGEHNNTIDSIILDTKDIETEVEVPLEKPRYDTPELRSVQNARQYQTYVQEKINAMPEAEREKRQPLVNVANDALTVAEESYRTGQTEKGDFAKELGLAGLDLALSLTPGVGLAKDFVELSTGYNFVTGAKLTTFERTMAAVGVLTVGYGSKLALAGKAGALIDIFKVGSKEVQAVEEFTKIASRAEKISEAAIEAGVKDRSVIQEVADSIKRNFPCRVALVPSRNPIDYFLTFIEPTAYAADCLPGQLEESVEKAFSAAKDAKLDLRNVDIARLKDNPLSQSQYTEKVLGQMKSDIYHGFSPYVDNFAGLGKRAEIVGGDGIKRLKVELPGGWAGKDGHFEWIIEPNQVINHRIFIPRKP
jgi:hypothetical protein